MAHPDDVDFWPGGTVASWTSAGTSVTYCVLTDGDSGGFDPRIPRSAIPDIRRDEPQAAAMELGVDDVRFLGYPDGRLAPSYTLRRDITRVIPARVIDELMGHAGGRRGGGVSSHDGSLIGTRYRWTTPEMEARVAAAIEQRLAVSFAVLPEESTWAASSRRTRPLIRP